MSASDCSRDVQHDGAGFEQLEVVALDGRDLAEGLQRAIAGAGLILGPDQPLP